MKAKVELTPLGNKFKWRIIGKLYCKRLNTELPNSSITTNGVGEFFKYKKEYKKFLKNNKRITKILDLSFYDKCDYIV
jgi:hypothetical protein